MVTIDDCQYIKDMDKRKRSINAVLKYQNHRDQWNDTIKHIQTKRDKPPSLKIKKIHQWNRDMRTLIETSK